MILCTGCIVKINKKHIYIPVNLCYSSSNCCLTFTDCVQFTDLHGNKFYESGISVQDTNVLLLFFLDSSSSVSFKFDVFNSLSLFSDVNCVQCLGNLSVLILKLIF